MSGAWVSASGLGWGEILTLALLAGIVLGGVVGLVRLLGKRRR